MSRLSSIYLHIFVLFAFAIAPLYSVVAGYSVFFITHRIGLGEVGFLLLVCTVLLPGLLALFLYVLKKGVPRAGDFLGLVVVGVLALLIALPIVGRVAPVGDLPVVIGSLVIALVFIFLYVRYDKFRLLITYASVAIVLIPLLFVTNPVVFSSVARGSGAVVAPEVESEVPVIMIVFDEFPLASLMGADYKIDRKLYPNFASLVDGSHWFRNATTVSTDTIYAVPSILTGNYPDGKKHLPILPQYPENLFVLLGSSYDISAYEANTLLCPMEINKATMPGLSRRLGVLMANLTTIYMHIVTPPKLAARALPPFDPGWGGVGVIGEGAQAQGGRNLRGDLKFSNFVKTLKDVESPSLSFLHIVLPHHPWIYYPSGSIYGNYGRGTSAILGLDKDYLWVDDQWQVAQGYQRHLLQVGHVDTLIGKLVRRLKDEGLYDKSLIVITADHGMSFRPGDEARKLSANNYRDVMSVPLIIKEPNQKFGSVSDRNVESVDILPTITQMLGIKIPWKVDGISAIGRRPARPKKVIFEDLHNTEKISPKRYVAASMEKLFEAVDRKVDLFKDGIYGIGPHGELLDRPAADLLVERASPVRIVRSFGIPESDEVMGDGVFSLGYIPGRALGAMPDGRRVTLAIAVNGIIRAVTKTGRWQSGAADFSFLIPESAFKKGETSTEIFVVSEKGRIKLLRTSRALKTDIPYSIGKLGDVRALVFHDTKGGVMGRLPLLDGSSRGKVMDVMDMGGGQSSVSGWVSERGIDNPLQKLIVFLDDDYLLTVEYFEKRPILEKGAASYRFNISLNKEVSRALKGGSTLHILILDRDGPALELIYREGDRG